VINNPFFWAVCLTAASAFVITFAVTLLPATEAIVVSVTVIAALILSYCAQSPETKKRLFSELSLCNSSLAGLIPRCIHHHPWYTEITPHITLGAAPLKSRGHFHHIRSTHHAVLSMVEAFEHSPHLMGVPVMAEDWHQAGLAFLHLPNQDLAPVRLEDVKRAVEWMHEHISQNRKVYIHCLAGISRSATIVICYLIKYGRCSPENAIAFVRSRRTIFVDRNHLVIQAFAASLL